MPQIPYTKLPDSTLALANDGYTFISKRCDRYHSDIFQTRLLARPTVCMRGEEAARIFYDTNHFKRKGVVPKHVLLTLFGMGGVQGLDGYEHRNRKQMFMELMSGDNIDYLAELVTEQWHHYAKKWEKEDEVILFEEVHKILCKAVCNWSGVPLKEAYVNLRASDFAAMIDGTGGIGLRYLKGKVSRQRTERWIGSVIRQVRSGELDPPEGSALQIIASHRDLDDALLDLHTAAVEVINILRPTIAVSRYITFAALAMHKYPEAKATLQKGGKDERNYFMQEVRRYYPFFPFAAAGVRRDFIWKGYSLKAGYTALLDLYGTNHDPHMWKEPNRFHPDRFRDSEINSYNLIPQGGGDYHENHRCPGEWIAMRLIEKSIDFLLNKMKYDVPGQNLNIRLSRMPAIPQSRFVISNVKCISG
jgi:fatty-acid peroxygenase